MLNTSANDWATRKRLEAARAEHVAEHGPACQICGAVPKTRGLQWDHDHKTGAHRGWLCHRCNRALPTWVTIDWLLDAARYLLAAEHPNMTLTVYFTEQLPNGPVRRLRKDADKRSPRQVHPSELG